MVAIPLGVRQQELVGKPLSHGQGASRERSKETTLSRSVRKGRWLSCPVLCCINLSKNKISVGKTRGRTKRLQRNSPSGNRFRPARACLKMLRRARLSGSVLPTLPPKSGERRTGNRRIWPARKTEGPSAGRLLSSNWSRPPGSSWKAPAKRVPAAAGKS